MPKKLDSYTRFARLYEPLLASPLNAVRHKVLAACLYHGFTSVLEFACGSGSQGLLLQNAGIQWVGLDKSLAMLQSASNTNHGRVNIVSANALQTPFRQASFSASLASLFLHEQSLADTHAILAEMRRVHELCDTYSDVATASLLEVWIDETERRSWFLYESCRRPQG